MFDVFFSSSTFIQSESAGLKNEASVEEYVLWEVVERRETVWVQSIYRSAELWLQENIY